MVKRLSRHRPHPKYYTSDGKQVVGASTIAGVHKPVDFLMGWSAKLAREGKDWKKERNKTADYGRVAHFMIECHLSGYEPDLSEFTEEEIGVAEISFDKFLRFWNENELEVIGTELVLVSDSLKFGGTIDLVGRRATRGVVEFDWKTSKRIYESHLFQAVGYKYLYDHQNLPEDSLPLMPPPDPIDEVCVVRTGRDGKEIEFETYWIPKEMIPKYWECFRSRLDVYNADKAIK